MPDEEEVALVDLYIQYTLYGTKPGIAREPLRSLQIPETDGVRMTMYYYNQTYFPHNYTEEVGHSSLVYSLTRNFIPLLSIQYFHLLKNKNRKKKNPQTPGPQRASSLLLKIPMFIRLLRTRE